VIDFSVDVRVRGLSRFSKTVKDRGPHVDRIMKRWSVITRSFLRRRFVEQSKGGSDWPPLAESTIRRRRRPKGKGSAAGSNVAVLRDTGILLAALSPQLSPGGIEDRDSGTFTLRVGYGGDAPHPRADMAISSLAKIHHDGGKHLPRRPVVVPPDQATVRKLTEDANKVIREELKNAGAGQ
jgi:hypothetical protein